MPLTDEVAAYDIISFNGVQAIPAFARQFGDFDPTLGRYALPASRSSLLTSVAFVGKFLGTLSAGSCTERYGHRAGLTLLSLSTIIGAVIQLTSKRPAQFLVGRVLVFVGIGVAENVVPTYQSELLPAAKRGFFVGSAQLFILLGALVANGVNRFYSTFQTSQGWIIPVAVQIIAPTILLCGIAFIPPSPRWLIHKGRREEAIRVLESVRPLADVRLGRCIEEINAIEELRLHEGLEKRPWGDLFRGTNRRRTFIAMMIFMYHQSTGESFRVLTVFYIRVGLASMAFTYNIIGSAVSIAVCIGGLFLLDSFGRRPVLVVGAFFQALWLMLVGGIGSLPDPTTASKHTVVAATILYTLSYSVSWSPFAAEVGTGALREKTMAISSTIDSILAFVVSFTLPYLLNPPFANLQAKVAYIYGSFAASAILYALFFVPETKGRSLEELDELFQHKPTLPAWKFKTFHATGLGARITALEKGTVEPADGLMKDYVQVHCKLISD
ncbi:general substrate transporter [Ramaria rubella]|nr:general substrate transporter [Ramaria rubella]